MVGLPFEGFWSGDVLGDTGAAASVPHGGLTARKLRALKLRKGNFITARMAKMTRESFGDDVEAFETYLQAAMEEIGLEPHRPGRAGRPDIFYAHVAWAYVKGLEDRARSPRRTRPTSSA